MRLPPGNQGGLRWLPESEARNEEVGADKEHRKAETSTCSKNLATVSGDNPSW